MSLTNKSKTYPSQLYWSPLLIFTIILTSWEGLVLAQVNSDKSLPNNSQVIQQGNIYNITGGTNAGRNLFHSFEKFSVPNGSEAYFNNAVEIQNIISRVTGKSKSEINGLIRGNGSANLFLINPNGIIFGENGKLDIGGSFVGSTADSIKFADGFEFSAQNPQSKPLLTVKVPLGLQYGNNPGTIELKSREIKVPANKTLALLGGNVLLEGTTLKASSGRIELGSVTGEGKVGITPVETGFSFGFDKLATQGEIQLSQNTKVDTSGDGAGDIQVTAKNLTIIDNSVIDSTQTGTEKSGNITINAQQLKLHNSAKITANVRDNRGKGGNINIKANNLKIEGGASINTTTFDKGNGGNLNVEVQNLEVIGTDRNGTNPSHLSTGVAKNSRGDGGDVNITSNNLLVEDGAFLAAGTSGEGNGGNMTINSNSKIEIRGQGGEKNKFSSGLFVTAEKPSKGDSGSLNINAKQMILRDGAFVNISNNSLGNAGEFNINADDFIIQNNVRFFSGRLNPNKEVGDVNITAKNFIVSDGSTVNVGTSSQSGNLNIDAQKIQVIGTGNNGNTPSQLIVKPSLGNTGNITIQTKEILIKDGAFVSTTTFEQGNGGNLNINAEDVQVVGKGGNNPGNNNQPYPSGLFATAEKSSIGNAGDLTINTQRMLVEDGAFVSTSTNSQNGNAGDLIIKTNSLQVGKDSKVISETTTQGMSGNLKITTNSLLVEDAGKISSATSSTGNGGDVTINSDTIKVKDNQAQITVESLGTGNAGILTLNARSISLDNTALLNASTQSSDFNNEQATINIINTRDLILRRGSNIFTNAKGENVQGGNININSDLIVSLENSDISANSENFRGGNVKIQAQGIFGTQFRELSTPQSDITATGATEDLSGTVEIIIPEINSTNDLDELPIKPVETKLAQGCYSRAYTQNQFFIVGRGGLPPKPEDFLTPSTVRVDWVNLQPKLENSLSSRHIRVKKNTEKSQKIIEATGWIVNNKGEIIFTANASVNTVDSYIQQNYKCE